MGMQGDVAIQLLLASPCLWIGRQSHLYNFQGFTKYKNGLKIPHDPYSPTQGLASGSQPAIRYEGSVLPSCTRQFIRLQAKRLNSTDWTHPCEADLNWGLGLPAIWLDPYVWQEECCKAVHFQNEVRLQFSTKAHEVCWMSILPKNAELFVMLIFL